MRRSWVKAQVYDYLRGRQVADDRVLFAEQLADVLELKVPLAEAVTQLSEQANRLLRTRKGLLAAALTRVSRALQEGAGLALALSAEPVFPGYWTSHVAAAERFGNLPATLRRLARLESDRDPARAYFWIVTVLGIAVAFFTGIFVLPYFTSLFEALNVPLPWATRLLLQVTRNLRNPAVQLPLALLFLILFVAWRARRERLAGTSRLERLRQQRLALSFVVSGLEAGMPLPEALDGAVLALPVDSRLAQALRPEGRTGASLGELLDAYPKLFSARVRWLARAGERSGQLATSLLAGQESLDLEYELARVRRRQLYQTGALLLSGVGVGFLVLGMILPLENMVAILSAVYVP